MAARTSAVGPPDRGLVSDEADRVDAGIGDGIRGRGGVGGSCEGEGRARGAPGRFREAVAPAAGVASGASPVVSAAALLDLRRRLRSAEREAKELREERAAVERRDRQVRVGRGNGGEGSV